MSDYNQYCSDCSHRDEHAPRVKPRVDPMKDQKHHGNLEHMGELGAVSAGGFALWEKHRADKDPEHARRHRLEEEAAAVGALGAGGYAFHEHHQKKGAYDQGRQHPYNY